MSQWSPSSEQRDKERFWRTKPKDPTAAFRKSGVPYYRPGKQRVLMPDDFMPLGPHAGKHLRAVPPDYLLWVNAQPWAKHWPHWMPIADYIERHPTLRSSTQESEGRAIIFITAQRGTTAELHCLPGFADHLHTFVLGTGVTDRSQFWNNPKYVEYPHYRLAERRFDLALSHGAVLIDATTRLSHIRQWRALLTHHREHSGSSATVPVASGSDSTPRTCTCTKHAYTKIEAETAMNASLTGRKAHRNTRLGYLRIYECPACGFWHLTSKQPYEK